MPKSGLAAVLAYGCLFWPLSQSVQADVNVTISGVVVAPPSCVINGGSTLTIAFGDDLMTTRIDGTAYRRAVPYTVICTNHPSNAMTLELKGTGAAFDAGVLATSKADLGVRLLVNGVNWPLNNTVKFTYPTLPGMQAVPVKRAGRTLTGGAFSATATLVVAQQ